MPSVNPERKRIAKLADAAEIFAKTFEAPHHVYKALDEAGVRDLAERKRLIGPIQAELDRRAPKPLSKRTDLIEDARRLESRHPEENEDEA